MEVAVIGAGLAGLCTLRYLLDEETTDIKKVVAFEQNSTVGGLWNYTEKTGVDEHGLPFTSNYRDMRTNDTLESTTFEDFPHRHPAPAGSFLKSEEILQYINDFADHFQLRKYIKFNTKVERVNPENQDAAKQKWSVEVRRVDKPEKEREKYMFDAVVVGNGQHTVPQVPNLPGLSVFDGRVMHSHDFRVQEAFAGQTVVVVGAAGSGVDIGMLIAKCAKLVYLSSWNPWLRDSSWLPDRMELVTTIKYVKAHSVVFDNGQEIAADSIVLCTGYRYSFPFLSEACHPKIDSERLFPLYKHIIHVDYPTLLFVGMCKLVPAFKFLPLQAQFVAAVIRGKVQLPSKEEMLEDIDKDYRGKLAMGLKHKHAHNMFPVTTLIKSYQESLVKLVKDPECITPIPEKYLELFTHLARILLGTPKLFRSMNLPLDTTNWSKLPGPPFPINEAASFP